jgi:hypothetical protein
VRERIRGLSRWSRSNVRDHQLDEGLLSIRAMRSEGWDGGVMVQCAYEHVLSRSTEKARNTTSTNVATNSCLRPRALSY